VTTRVVGTAGHVDHGKSTLITALTGMDPDRLREEQERGMTIDLGFAWITTPSGTDIGIVDVPGHQDFIRNMLAGVGSIDAVILVVAADEGVRPQTREHLAILGLLGIERGVVAITKRDLIDDAWAELVRGEVRAALAATPLADAPLVEVSALARTGLFELVASLESVLGDAPRRRDTGRPRLPVDRAFTMAGFGTVVTGTLLDGELGVGDEVELVPGGLRARIRGLQTHRRALERRLAEPSESSVTGQTMADVLVCRFMPWERTRALRLIDVATHELVRRSESICANLEQDGAAQSNEGWTHVDTEGGRSSLDGLSMDWHDPQVNR